MSGSLGRAPSGFAGKRSLSVEEFNCAGLPEETLRRSIRLRDDTVIPARRGGEPFQSALRKS
jgi:hypothetical protein